MINLLRLIVVFSILILLRCNFAPGSFPNAEYYEFNNTENEIVTALKTFKTNNPEYSLPEGLGLKDGRKNASDYWYHVYFYYPIENQIVYTWIRQKENGKSWVALVRINEGTKLGQWKDINRDFNNADNKIQKKKFEERILNKIKANLIPLGIPASR